MYKWRAVKSSVSQGSLPGSVGFNSSINDGQWNDGHPQLTPLSVAVMCWRDRMPSRGTWTGWEERDYVNFMKFNNTKCKGWGNPQSMDGWMDGWKAAL